MLTLPRIVLDKNAERRRHAWIGPSKIGTNFLPAMASVGRLKEHIGSEIQNVRIDRRKDHRLRAVQPVLARANHPWADVLNLPGPPVEFRKLPAVQNIRMQR